MHSKSVVFLICLYFGLLLVPFQLISGENEALSQAVRQSIDKGIDYYYSLNVNGGYCYFYSLDKKKRWGEDKLDDRTIEVQAPGTPAVGMTFLRAYHITNNKKYLSAAMDAALALVRGQTALGGWDHTISPDQEKPRQISFDDDQTQGALRFLMAIDQDIDNDSLSLAIKNGFCLMLDAQLPNGGWPHMYPLEGDYHDYATFNDQGINDCVRVMLDAWRYYKKKEYKTSLKKVGRFIVISQLPPPQPGWAQQYNEYLQPAWARDFEPPAVCPQASLNNVFTLMDMYDALDDDIYLKPIPDALRWIESIRLPNGKWGRFIELGTGQPMYYDRGRIRVNSVKELHVERSTGYGYETDISVELAMAKRQFSDLQKGEKRKSTSKWPELSDEELTKRVKKIIKLQDNLGRWVTKDDRFKNIKPGIRWDDEYIVMDRISGHVFNRNMNLLCEYLERQ
ncbi:hypothetical protein JW960_00840 [candidate division KSB1 bacterium]|nr:hypothetical protein [candidate division KSB1 bacterium]